MNIEVLLTEAEIAQEFAESIEARDLPEKFFYRFPPSVRAWRELASSEAYQNLQGAWDLIAARADRIASHFPAAAPVVSFGAGDGTKDLRVAQSLARAGKQVKYFPVDASLTLLEAACSAAEDEDLEALGIKADISSPMHLMLASDAAESPKLFLMGGNTLGGFDPLDQIRHVAACLHAGDRLIVDAQLYREDSIAFFEQPKSVKFAFAPLASFGVQEDDGEIRFEVRRDDRHAGLHMVAQRFHAHRDLRMMVYGEEFQMARGERILMNFRYLFAPEAFRWLLEEHGGLKLLSEVVSSDGLFTAAICSTL